MDASPQMLRVARQKTTRRDGRLQLVHGDYRSYRFPFAFDAAICMYWTLGAHLTDDELRSALTQIRGYVRPRGLLALDVENADGIKRAQLDRLFSDYVVRDRKGLLVRFNHSRLQGEAILDWQAIYLLQKGEKLKLLHDRIRLRFFHVTELKRLLHETLFKVCEVSGGPSQEFDPTGPSIYVIAQRR
jgi:SAM-dependent methyltransferase